MTDLRTAHDRQDGQEPALDFEAMYQGREVAFGTDEDHRTDVIPWQLDAPQPLVVELEAAGEITGPVLECGCGLGDNALFLAGRGHEVTAFDAAPSAIERCRAKAVAAGSPVTFMVADATELHASGVPGGFRTVVDSAMLHCLDADQRRAYLAGLRRVCAPGATLHVLCFRGELAAHLQMPAATDERSLREALRDDWTIRRMEPRHYATGLTQQEWQKLAPAVPGDPEQGDLVTVDENGRVLLPFWQITAELT
ncbi:transferase [Streptomyces noursei ATCC 11455]|uniref:class I SAM-dependent methyltransferase n=1 Tax=Streptomyces noursei TaxID=1971 RepID=UPI00081C9544|nr:transferase [Streptomyces noursei ATCC 11455]